MIWSRDAVKERPWLTFQYIRRFCSDTWSLDSFTVKAVITPKQKHMSARARLTIIRSSLFLFLFCFLQNFIMMIRLSKNPTQPIEVKKQFLIVSILQILWNVFTSSKMNSNVTYLWESWLSHLKPQREQNLSRHTS